MLNIIFCVSNILCAEIYALTIGIKLCWEASYTTEITKISEGYLVRKNVKSLSNSVTKFCDQGICEEFHFFRH